MHAGLQTRPWFSQTVGKTHVGGGVDPSSAHLVGRGKLTLSSEAVSTLRGSRAISIQPLPEAVSSAGRPSVLGCGFSRALGLTVDSRSPPGGSTRGRAALNLDFPAAGSRGVAGLDLMAARRPNCSQGGPVLPLGRSPEPELKRPLSGGWDH